MGDQDGHILIDSPQLDTTTHCDRNESTDPYLATSESVLIRSCSHYYVLSKHDDLSDASPRLLEAGPKHTIPGQLTPETFTFAGVVESFRIALQGQDTTRDDVFLGDKSSC